MSGDPRGYTRKDLEKLYSPLTQHGIKVSTETLDATTTTETITFSDIPEKVSWQSSETLAGTVEFSINGVDFFGSVAFAATVPGSYSTFNVVAVKVTRTGGSGQLHIAANA